MEVVTMTTVYITDDYSALGTAATEADLDRYELYLERHLAAVFGVEICVKRCLGGGRSMRDDNEIQEYVHELESGDGWISLLRAHDERRYTRRIIALRATYAARETADGR